MSALRSLAPDLYVADRPLPLPVGDVGARMTIVRLANGGLFVHSPVRLDAETKEALDALGEVRAIVAPCLLHHLFISDYATAYPSAAIYGPKGLDRKRKDVAFTGVLDDEAPELWRGQLEQVWVRGAPAMNEVAFFHVASRTLLLTDLVFNVPKDRTQGARIFYWFVGAAGRFGPHRIVRFCFRDKPAVRASMDRILEWDFDRITLAHGEVVETGGREKLRAAFSFLPAAK